LDTQELSDEAFDSLKHELYLLEQQYPEFITPDSPTQRVGGEPLKEFKKVTHEIQMFSIEDIFSLEELKNWESHIKRLEDKSSFEYFVEPKIDGFGISLLYEDGRFKTGSTRGNGKVGEDVTQNLKTIESIPLRLEAMAEFPSKSLEQNVKKMIKRGKIEIRGEVYMDKEDFREFNKKIAKSGGKQFSNPRNLAAGSIRQLDPKLAASRPLKFLGYDVITDFGQVNHSQEHQILQALGIRAALGRIYPSVGGIAEYWEKIAKDRDKFPYQIDGVVVSVNDNETFKRLGVAGKSPRGIRAFKFSPRQSTTRIIDVRFQV
jgi:DNA ligase (NAD+)